jgi:hypothetical protein
MGEAAAADQQHAEAAVDQNASLSSRALNGSFCHNRPLALGAE